MWDLGSVLRSGETAEFETNDQIMLNEQKQTVNVTQFNHLKPMYTFSLSQLIDFFFFFLVEAE